MRRQWLPLTILAFSIVASALAWAHGGAGHLLGEVTVAERAAFEDARAVFEKNCMRCHAKGGKKEKAKARAHLDMTAYPFGGHHAGEAGDAVKAAVGAGPKRARATMPSDNPGAVTGDDLKLVLAWADAFAAAHPSAADTPPKHGR